MIRTLRGAMAGLRAGYQATLKAPETEETLDRVLYRPLAYLGVCAVEPLPVTPNQITLFSIAVGLAAGGCFALGTPWGLAAGALAVFLFNVLDCADGMLARRRGSGSPMGYILDGIAGYLGTTAIVLGLGQAAVVRNGEPLLWWSLTVAAGLSLAWWCAVVDGLRLDWMRRVHGQRQDRNRELAAMVQSAEEWRRAGTHRADRMLVSAYAFYVRLWEGKTLRERAPRPEDAVPTEDWAPAAKPILRLAVAAGPTMQLTAIIAAAALGRPEWFLVAAVTIGNAWGAVVLILRASARRQLLAQLPERA